MGGKTIQAGSFHSIPRPVANPSIRSKHRANLWPFDSVQTKRRWSCSAATANLSCSSLRVRKTIELGPRFVSTPRPIVQRSIAFHPNGNSFVVLLNEPWVRVLKTDSGEELRRFKSDSFATDAAFSIDGKWICTAAGQQATIWNYTDASEPARVLDLGARVEGIDFSLDGAKLATACSDRTARIWNWRDGELACPAMMHPDDVLDVRFIPSGKALLSVCRNPAAYRGRLRAWETETGRLLAPSLPMSGFSPRTIDLANNGDRAVISGILMHSHIVDLSDFANPGSNRTALLPADALIALAELQSGLRMIGNGMGTANLSTTEWMERWKAFRSRFPHHH
jgi:WD40 repeat protein